MASGVGRWGQPLLGICLGCKCCLRQVRIYRTPGLGVLQGQVLRLPSQNDDGDINSSSYGLEPPMPGPACRNEPSAEPRNQYFVHSYSAVNVDPHAVMYDCRYATSRLWRQCIRVR